MHLPDAAHIISGGNAQSVHSFGRVNLGKQAPRSLQVGLRLRLFVYEVERKAELELDDVASMLIQQIAEFIGSFVIEKIPRFLPGGFR